MGFRFQKRISILPGISINLGKRGASVSVGPRGLKTTISSRGVKHSIGLPGTGYATKHRMAEIHVDRGGHLVFQRQYLWSDTRNPR